MKLGYASYSIDDKDLEIQKTILKKAGCKEIIEDKEPEAKTDRPGLARFIDKLEPGDYAIVWRLDRLARSYKELVQNVGLLASKSINLISIEESIDTTSSDGKSVFKVFMALNKFGADLLTEQTKPGLVAARARGIKGGRKEKLTGKQKGTLYKLYDSKEHSIGKICKKLNISRPTLYSYLEKRKRASKIEHKQDVEQIEKKKDNVVKLPVINIEQECKPIVVSQSKEIYQFKIWLEGIRPQIWRRFQVGSNRTLEDLHFIIQVLFDWGNYHLHKFHVHKTGRYTWDEEPEDEDNTLESYSLELDDFIYYDYDFGDQWMHTLKLEKVLRVNSKSNYLNCRTGGKAAPPEDSGGPMGYMEILKAIKRRRKKAAGKIRWKFVSFDGFLGIPLTEEDDYRLNWLNEVYPNFDPSKFDKDSINKQLNKLVSELVLT